MKFKFKDEEWKVFRTPKVKIAYPSLFEKDKNDNYSAIVIIDAKDKAQMEWLKGLRAAIDQMAEESHGKKAKKAKKPIKEGEEMVDGEDETRPGFEGTYFFRVGTKKLPLVVNHAKEDIEDPDEIYGGVIGFASLNLYSWSRSDGCGVSVGLRAFQKVGNGPKIGGSGGNQDARDDFEELDADEEFSLEDEKDDDEFTL